MNKITFTLLGCSGILALILALSETAVADTTIPQYADFLQTPAQSSAAQSLPVQPSAAQSLKANGSQAPINSNPATLDAMSDRVGDVAIAQFGCDCAGCRNQALQMLQGGPLTLSQ